MKAPLRIALIAGLSLFVIQSINGTSALPPMFASKPTLAAALAASKIDGRTAVAFYTADWCGPCSRMKSGALRDAEVVKAFENLHPAIVDCTNGTPADDPFGIESYPTMIAIRDGKVINRLNGNQSTPQLLGWLKEINAPQ